MEKERISCKRRNTDGKMKKEKENLIKETIEQGG